MGKDNRARLKEVCILRTIKRLPKSQVHVAPVKTLAVVVAVMLPGPIAVKRLGGDTMALKHSGCKTCFDLTANSV